LGGTSEKKRFVKEWIKRPGVWKHVNLGHSVGLAAEVALYLEISTKYFRRSCSSRFSGLDAENWSRKLQTSHYTSFSTAKRNGF
jgi:hypothetical protein